MDGPENEQDENIESKEESTYMETEAKNMRIKLQEGRHPPLLASFVTMIPRGPHLAYT